MRFIIAANTLGPELCSSPTTVLVVDTAFRQQRLKAWQPILTPKTVLPTLFLVGILFAPIGGLLIWGSDKVSVITLDYTHCDTRAPTDSSFTNLEHYSYHLRSSDSSARHTTPQWTFTNITANPPATQAQCTIKFNVPADLQPPVFLYYKLTSFYQNHRRYVKSYDPDQLRGKHKSADSLNKGDCKPLAKIGDKAVYPCGLIANSIFNGAAQPSDARFITRTYDTLYRHVQPPREYWCE